MAFRIRKITTNKHSEYIVTGNIGVTGIDQLSTDLENVPSGFTLIKSNVVQGVVTMVFVEREQEGEKQR